MANLDFRKFQRRNKIRLFRLATLDKKPGAIVEKDGMSYTVVQTLKNLLGGESHRWRTSLNPATLVSEDVEKKYSLTGLAKINKFGVNIKGGLELASQVKYTISEIGQRRFSSLEWDDIAEELIGLHRSKPKRLKRLMECFVIVFVYYAAELKIEFDTDVKASIGGQFKGYADVDVAWESGSNRVLRITDNNKVPFGFRGWEIGKTVS